ncbi:acyl-CoA synthetase [Hyphomonas pacifica]|uniref:Acyl-CoA synthetase n=1 Tax=Hyphomonas pacifica TaxID=1280941 RepID=A0A062TR95_9PROT|nr:acyl-CoA synthetase [Hyphomonas pacifica]KCZ50341.1 acyl-CoA synthetase [Hyphomonas pacifica]RAN32614.1 acyl-CoA synthetase [Hyphomonas pacifica]
MHPCHHAKTSPDKPAYIMAGSGETVTFRQLDERSNQIAHAFRNAGLKPGDTIALFAENSPRYFEICWAAQRSGLYFVCISSRLTAPEVQYIVEDSGSSLLIASKSKADVATKVKEITQLHHYWSIGGDIPGYQPLESHQQTFPVTPIADEMSGTDMLYSSGTTGRPKGIRPALEPNTPIDADNVLVQITKALAGGGPGDIYLSPAPLYHAAPLRWCMTFTRLGATLIIMEKFDPETFLEYVQKYKVTHTQMVPTMFVKLLKLPEDVRKSYDVSSLKFVIHAAAPCPIPVKEQMIEWWGPIIDEYYAGSEGNGMTWVKSPDWLSHKGTVGRPVHGELHICDESGDEVPVGTEGQIYFGGTAPPNYHNAPDKNASALNPKHPDWSSLGDVGRVDEDGFLYLTDRKAFMIISGGVNIYPQEAENVLITHPKVADVAVIGIPDDEFGEAVKAVVQPMPGIAASDELAEELLEFCRSELSKIKCPKSIDFDPELPRHATGKLYKRLIRDRYWGKSGSRIV